MPRRYPLPATIAVVALATAWAVAQVCPARAEDETAIVGDVVIEGASATAAKAGETTRVTFTIENAGADAVSVTGVRLSIAGPSRVIGSLGTSHSARMDGFPVEAGEINHLDGKRAWIEVGPLASDLLPGTVITGHLLLGTFEAPLSIHVVGESGRNGEQKTAKVTSASGSAVSAHTTLHAVRC